MADVDQALAELAAWWRGAAHADVVAADQQVAALHELARRVEGRAGPAAGHLLREAADLVADAADELRRDRPPEIS